MNRILRHRRQTSCPRVVRTHIAYTDTRPFAPPGPLVIDKTDYAGSYLADNYYCSDVLCYTDDAILLA